VARVEIGPMSDDRVIAAARDGIASSFVDVDLTDIERVVREELVEWRHRARVQTFVPVFAQRSARERIQSGRLSA
jgi:hypothetical protein